MESVKIFVFVCVGVYHSLLNRNSKNGTLKSIITDYDFASLTRVNEAV
jgi:hypothetical protein